MRKYIKITVGIISLVLIVAAIIFFFWLRSNTSLFTANITDEDLNANNLNTGIVQAPQLYPAIVAGKNLNLPEGFNLDIYASDISSARFMAVNENDTIYVGSKDNDKIYAIPDANKDGNADQTIVIDSNLRNPHSVYYYEGDLFVGEENQVSVYKDIGDDGTYSERIILVNNLPSGNTLTGGGHTTRTVVVGPDKKLYVSIGSSCNVCIEDDERRASIMRYNLDGTGGELFAEGLRNTVGFLFDGLDMIGVDMGRDQIGDDIPPEEINNIVQGKNYGWPYCYGNKIVNPEFPEYESFCKNQTEPPLFEIQAHSAPLGITKPNQAVKDKWPKLYRDGYFIALHGSWNRTIPTGYKVVFINKENDNLVEFTFVSGWLEQNAEAWGRPVDMVFDGKGTMYISDDKLGNIYRVTYDGS